MFLAKMWATATDYLLSLAILGDVTQIGSFLLAKASTTVTVTGRYHWHYHPKLGQGKYGLMGNIRLGCLTTLGFLVSSKIIDKGESG
jgi:hypothetical protein